MGVSYRLVHERDVPTDLGWLSPAERQVVAGLRIEKRRHDWLLGRWTAKSLLVSLHPGSRPQEWTLPASDSGAPIVERSGTPVPLVLSLSHRGVWGLCMVRAAPGVLGCDIELVEPRGPAFNETWFTTAEMDAVESAALERRPVLTTLIWSAKEAALKASRTGLRVDTRAVEVAFEDVSTDVDWRPLRITWVKSGESHEGCWRPWDGNYLFTLVGAGAAVQHPG